MKTKDKILFKSLEMFNANGSNTVTTNHIAKECNISPGNLYYHFKNKEHIIIKLFEELSIEFEPLFKKEIIDCNISLSESIIQIYRKYKFFQLDLVELLRNNPELKDLYYKNVEKKKKRLIELFRLLIDLKYLIKMSEETMENLFDMTWFFSEFSFSFTEISYNLSEADELDFLRKKIRFIFEPYLTKEGLVALKNFI